MQGKRLDKAPWVFARIIVSGVPGVSILVIWFIYWGYVNCLLLLRARAVGLGVEPHPAIFVLIYLWVVNYKPALF